MKPKNKRVKWGSFWSSLSFLLPFLSPLSFLYLSLSRQDAKDINKTNTRKKDKTTTFERGFERSIEMHNKKGHVNLHHLTRQDKTQQDKKRQRQRQRQIQIQRQRQRQDKTKSPLAL